MSFASDSILFNGSLLLSISEKCNLFFTIVLLWVHFKLGGLRVFIKRVKWSSPWKCLRNTDLKVCKVVSKWTAELLDAMCFGQIRADPEGWVWRKPNATYRHQQTPVNCQRPSALCSKSTGFRILNFRNRCEVVWLANDVGFQQDSDSQTQRQIYERKTWMKVY